MTVTLASDAAESLTEKTAVPLPPVVAVAGEITAPLVPLRDTTSPGTGLPDASDKVTVT